MTSAHVRPAIRERELLFGARVARLLGLPAEAGISHATIDEALGKAPLLEVRVVLPLTTEQALRLRYGDDAVVTRTARGWTVEFPVEDRQAPTDRPE